MSRKAREALSSVCNHRHVAVVLKGTLGRDLNTNPHYSSELDRAPTHILVWGRSIVVEYWQAGIGYVIEYSFFFSCPQHSFTKIRN